jgi:ADP-ribosylglycohydrolase
MVTGMDRVQRAVGAVVGAAVGDALGAPFEFGNAGEFTGRFPEPGYGGEMCGGRLWGPGEATDDTQMAVHVAQSLLDHDGLDLADIFARFQRWADGHPKDIGNQTNAVLHYGEPWDRAATVHFERNSHAAGNGSLMRATPSAVYFAREGRAATMDAARRISALTHGDQAAGDGTAIFHELVRVAMAAADPLDAIADTLAEVDSAQRERYAVVLAPDWHPEAATESNGAVWPCLGSAVWALRNTTSFEDALRAAVDLGGDTDTVAAVTGGLAGAVYGDTAIPRRWTDPLFIPLPGTNQTLRKADLVELTHRLLRTNG